MSDADTPQDTSEEAAAAAPSSTNGTPLPTSRFAELVVEEWPGLAREAVNALAEDREALTALIAERFDHTKALVRKKLGELERLVGTAEGREQSAERVEQLLEELRAKSEEATKYVRDELARDARIQVREHPLVSILMAVTFGLLLGFFLRGLGRGR
jgi:ElaB/YqjD/DUF883 family membrane-anchored ribosome-binding protein